MLKINHINSQKYKFLIIVKKCEGLNSNNFWNWAQAIRLIEI